MTQSRTKKILTYRYVKQMSWLKTLFCMNRELLCPNSIDQDLTRQMKLWDSAALEKYLVFLIFKIFLKRTLPEVFQSFVLAVCILGSALNCGAFFSYRVFAVSGGKCLLSCMHRLQGLNCSTSFNPRVLHFHRTSELLNAAG